MTGRIRPSLSFRLTLWYTGIFTLSACVAFLLFYLFITAVIRERLDRDLLNQAGQFSVALREQGIRAAEELAVIEAQAAGVKKVFYRLLYPTGEAFSSSNLASWREIGIRQAAIARLLAEDQPVFETVSPGNRPEKVRVLYARIGPAVILQVGQSLEADARLIAAFRGVFAVTMVLLIALAAGVGWFMARRAVAGVEAIARTARGISGGSLTRRVPVAGTGDEIDQLAATVNEMLDRIEKLVTEIREMGDNIAHDLKSPLTRIRGAAEVTLTTAGSVADYETMAAGAIEECDRLLGLIDTMLMISRTEAGVQKPVLERVDLAALLREVCDLFATAAQDRGLTLEALLPGRLEIAGDSRMLQRLLANLLDNALKYTPAGGAVTVSLASRADTAEITVADTGIGIDAADLPRIFERFYRCDRSRAVAGTGLGLSLARAIARAHGGEITAASRPDAGSRFQITLPSGGTAPA
jgi:heavy metal sensor kinase